MLIRTIFPVSSQKENLKTFWKSLKLSVIAFQKDKIRYSSINAVVRVKELLWLVVQTLYTSKISSVILMCNLPELIRNLSGVTKFGKECEEVEERYRLNT